MQSYSQHGEDVAIHELIDAGAERCAVDVGANDGQSWSNSYLFGLEGYRLLLIEPMPEYARRCRELYAGSADVVVEEYAVAPEAGEATFFVNEDATTDELAMRSSLARELVPSTKVNSITVKTVPRTPSCRNGWPSGNSPRACSVTIFAQVPVPHGERSSAPVQVDGRVTSSVPVDTTTALRR